MLALLGAPLAQGASKYPTVSKVSPLKAGIGDTLTIQGKGFRSGKNKNTVVFRSTTGKTVFAKAGAASATRIQIVIPSKLMPYMKTSGSSVVATKFRIRVVAKKLGKKYTASSKSPTIGPTPLAAKGANAGANGDCDSDGILNGNEADDDNDLLPDTLETQIGTSTCSADTEGDGITDGYEYYSALEYNSLAVPYPGKRPYANALFSDANIDYDGDGLTLWQEYAAWSYSGRPFPLNYAEGNQWTGGKTLVANAGIHGSGSEDLNGDGTIADWEKDVDNDGLVNWSEAVGSLSSPGWWNGIYGNSANTCGHPVESPYPVSNFSGLNFVDPDTDGDGIKDGPDDIDHDGYSNHVEMIRPADWCTTYVSTAFSGGANPNPVARVQPFNPCKPTYSDLCHQVIPAGYYPAGEDWASPYHGTL
jgi:hypothetical protein